VVTWGQAMKGRTFLQAFEDESYAQWCLSNLKPSGRASGPGQRQKRFMRYIELKVMADEALLMNSKETYPSKGQETKKKTNQPGTSSTPSPKPSPKAKSIVKKEKVETSGLEKPVPSTEVEWEMTENPELHHENTAHLAALDSEVNQMQGRLIGIEAMLTQIVQHLQPPPQ
jgi:hypothetical protein